MGMHMEVEDQLPNWEARLEAPEDSRQLYAPIVLQETKDGDCTIQDLHV